MTEQELYKRSVRPWCEVNGIFVHRIESKAIPDVYMAKNGFSLWGELKCVIGTPRVVRPGWRPGQLAWIKKNWNHQNYNICLILWYGGQEYWMPPQEVYLKEELRCHKQTYLTALNLE